MSLHRVVRCVNHFAANAPPPVLPGPVGPPTSILCLTATAVPPERSPPHPCIVSEQQAVGHRLKGSSGAATWTRPPGARLSLKLLRIQNHGVAGSRGHSVMDEVGRNR